MENNELRGMWSSASSSRDVRDGLRVWFSEASDEVRSARLLAVPGKRPSMEAGERNGKKTRFASVLMVLVPGQSGEWEVILMERTPYEGVHGGQVSLPGGEVESFDASRLHTALREFEEEMGVTVHASNVVGELTPLYIPPSGFEVEAFVAVLDEEPIWRVDRTEVEAVLHLPIRPLPTLKTRRVEMHGAQTLVPAFECEGRTVWGATAILLAEFFAVLAWGSRKS